MKKDYTMCVDDSGYSYTQFDSNGHEHEIAGIMTHGAKGKKWVELGHHKYFVGILIPTDKLLQVSIEITRAANALRKAINTDKEIHATEIYGDNEYKQAFLKYLNRITRITQMYDLKIFVSPKDSTIRIREQNKIAGALKNYVKNGKVILPTAPSSSPSKKAMRRATLKYQKLSLLELHNMASLYLSDGGCISTILCDEGVQKAGTQVQIDENTNMLFLSSDENPLIQFADNIAWLYNRVNVVVPDRIGRRKCEMLDSDVSLMSALDEIQHLIVEQSKLTPGSNKDLLESFLEARFNNGPTILAPTFQGNYAPPRVSVGKVKYPIVPIDDRTS